MVRRTFFAFALVALCVPAYSAELEIGTHAAEFKALPGVDGKEYSLPDMKDAKAVVVCLPATVAQSRWPMKIALSSSARSIRARA